MLGARGVDSRTKGGRDVGRAPALAQFAGQTVAAAAITDVWESVRGRIAQLVGRVRKPDVAERWVAETRKELVAAGPQAAGVQTAVADRWAQRFRDMLDEEPGLEDEVRVVMEQIAAQLPGISVAAGRVAIVAGHDLNITASRGAVATGVNHGDIIMGPTKPGPALP